MKNLTSLMLFTLIVYCLLSCTKEDHNPIIGKWEWIKMSSGPNNVITAESVDSTYYIEFCDSGSYNYFNNSKNLVYSRKYELGKMGSLDVYGFSGSNGTLFTNSYIIKSDTLITSDLSGLLIWKCTYKRIQ